MSRHGSEDFIENKDELYEEFLDERGVSKITHYRTPRWPKLTAKVRARFNTVRYIWKPGDRYWQLASIYYGDPKLWWAIAWYNEKPTEGHLKAGSVVLIPQPIEKLLSFFNFGSM
tara:strand:- start:2067 stop:2411 length:345 start_codon:yes stop_codon:yes gene_type:complete